MGDGTSMWNAAEAPSDADSRPSPRETFAYQVQRDIFPLGALCCFAAAPVIYLTYSRNALQLATYLLVLGGAFLAIRFLWLPRFRSDLEVDIASLLVLLGCVVGNWIGDLSHAPNTVVSSAFLLMVGAFAFNRSLVFSTYVGITLVGHGVSHTWTHGAVGIEPFFAVAPIYAFLARFAVVQLQSRVTSARQGLRAKIGELEREKKLRLASEKQLVHAQKMEGLGLLAAGVAHDFNNRLQAIQGLAELIELEGGPSATAREIQSATRGAAEICDQMLAFAGKTQTRTAVLDLVKVVIASQSMLRAALPKSIRMEYRIPDESLWVEADETALQRCLTNMVLNAVDARPATITVAVKRDRAPSGRDWRGFGSERPLLGEGVVLEILDDGCGMDSETLERSFDPYFTTKETGHGFGLATTLGIVRSFGGAIFCRTAPGQGTRMHVHLPEQARTLRADPVAGGAETARSGAAKSVLLVEDEERVRRVAIRLLERSGFEVESAASAAQALEAVSRAQRPFDLLLLDYTLPDGTGLDLLEAVRRAGIDATAILCSGFAPESIPVGGGAHPDAFLSKPYRMADLERVIAELSA